MRVKKAVMVEIGRELVKRGSLESFGEKGRKEKAQRGRSVVFNFRWSENGFLQERVYSLLLQRLWETASRQGSVDKMNEKSKKVRSNRL